MIQFLGASLKKKKKQNICQQWVSIPALQHLAGTEWLLFQAKLDIVTSWQWGVGK